mgnify:CR=1 FL=1
MKKVDLLCGLIALMTTSCVLFNQNKEEKFVNPLFYKQLAPFALGSKETYLTPTSMRYSNSIIHTKDDKHKDGWTVVPCKLLENKENYIVLKCKDIYWQGKGKPYDIYKYQLEDCFIEDKNGKCTSLYVKEYHYDEYSTFPGESTYAVELD